VGADAALERTIEKAKEKRTQELEKAGSAYHKQVEKANTALAKAIESAAAAAKRKKDDSKAESLSAAIEKVKAGEAPEAGIASGDAQLEGAIKRRASELETAEKAFKGAVDRANATLEQSYNTAIAGYKRKSDPRADELAAEFATIKAEAVTPVAGEAAAPKGGNGSQELIKSIGDSLINLENKTVSSKAISTQEYVLVYFSASWCGPCRAFTPELVKFHEDYAKKGKFEVVFVSACNSEKDMLGYMTADKMPWLAVPYPKVAGTGLQQKYAVTGIPRLVVLDKEGKNISAAGGARQVLADFKMKIGAK
jgi:thiol-disulfide isomerase/thioredoxin